MKFYLFILYDNLYNFVYNVWQHGTCITQQSIKVLHVPKRGALQGDI